MMNRRTLIGAVAASAALPLLNRVVSAQTSPKTRNVVFVHGLFADGSCWSKVIARLQQKGVNCTSVQNPLTSLHEASEAARRAIAAQPGPTVLVGHSFSGMIVSDVGVDPKVTALVYVAARAPDAGEDYTALAKNYPTPPATAGIVFNDDWGQLSEKAFLHDFAGDLPPEEALVLYAVQQPFKKSLTTEKTTNAACAPSRPSMPYPPKTGRSIPTWSASWRSEWVRRRSRSRREAYLLGIIELTTAALLAAGAFIPILSALGSLMGIGTFAITWSFFFSTPGVVKWSVSTDPIAWNLTGEFLYKDVVLLCVCIVLFLASLPKKVVPLRSN
jgi:pimeloyl-ACP methyl ester carboxylesterase